VDAYRYLYIEMNQVRLVKSGTVLATIPASSVTEISYGQDVHRRVGAALGLAVVTFGLGALMALSKSKKHFVGITWADGDKKGGAMGPANVNARRHLPKRTAVCAFQEITILSLCTLDHVGAETLRFFDDARRCPLVICAAEAASVVVVATVLCVTTTLTALDTEPLSSPSPK
jgi:hypothetical protein